MPIRNEENTELDLDEPKTLKRCHKSKCKDERNRLKKENIKLRRLLIVARKFKFQIRKKFKFVLIKTKIAE